MASKSSIFLVFAVLAQSSAVFGTHDSCASSTEIQSTFGTIKFAQTTERTGYLRSAQVAYTEILAVLNERLDENYTSDSKESELRAQRAENESFTGPLNGVLPNCEAIRIIQPELDIAFVVPIATEGRRKVNRNIFEGIKAAKGKNFGKARHEIAKHAKTAREGGVSAIKLFYSAMTNGSRTIPDEAKSAIDCMQEKTENAIDAALGYIFDEINILAKALHNNKKSKEAIDKATHEITAAHEKASVTFSAEIGYKFQVLRNIALQQYFDSAGTVTGLFAVQSVLSE